MSKLQYTCWLILCGAATSAAAKPALSRHEFTEPHMGTRFQIILYAPDKENASRAAKAAFARIADLDGIMSDYRPASELMRLCKKAGGAPVRVSGDLFRVLEKAQEVSRLSDGAFDVTVGPVVKLWRRARRTKHLPPADKLAEARALVGYKYVRLDKKDRTVQLAKKGMQLDLGGIAKGYAADAALRVLKQHGISSALVAAGGDIAVSDAPPGKKGWKVGIAPLENPNDKPKKFLLLKNTAVSTSGDAEQFVEIGGKRYSHIVDPKTGLGLVGRMSVSVVAPNGTTADSLTKVVCVLGPKRGFAILDKIKGVSSYAVWKTEKGKETFASKRFHTVPTVE